MKVAEAREWLGLDQRGDVSMETLRKAYKKACLKHHPDRNPGDDGATARFQCVGDAFERICLDIKRREKGGGRGAASSDEDNGGGGGRRAGPRTTRKYNDDDDDDDDGGGDYEDEEGFEFEAMFREHFQGKAQTDFFADMEHFFEDMIRETQTWDRRAFFKRRHKLKETFRSPANMAAAWKNELELRRQRRMDKARMRREALAREAAFARAEAEGRPCYESWSVDSLVGEARRQGVSLRGTREAIAERLAANRHKHQAAEDERKRRLEKRQEQERRAAANKQQKEAAEAKAPAFAASATSTGSKSSGSSWRGII